MLDYGYTLYILGFNVLLRSSSELMPFIVLLNQGQNTDNVVLEGSQMLCYPALVTVLGCRFWPSVFTTMFVCLFVCQQRYDFTRKQLNYHHEAFRNTRVIALR